MEFGKYQGTYVYGLDIGTRSIVGTVGYKVKDRFVVVAQYSKEHETRAMLDGQIHDILAVGETIQKVTHYLEEEVGQPLKEVCIAAAGRVLRTVTVHVENEFEQEKEVSQEDIYALDSAGVEKAYETFQEENDSKMHFYCVGYSVIKYFLNGYPIGNLESHKAKTIAEDVIVTFLPDDVVDGLQKSVSMAGLEVANMTLEPIAAIELAIPERYRMLNIALIDVGAGTSDISITKDGSIIAYGMLPIAGDCLTEDIARECLVDFATAERIKRGVCKSNVVEYQDIMGLPQTITKEEVLKAVDASMDSMAKQAADKIRELNGDKSVSAVFVVGGGGRMEGYTDKVADYLGIAKERCAVRGEEVMQNIDFMQSDVEKTSLLVTPIGICLNYYEQSNNFIFVSFNNVRIKLYDNNKLSVIDAAMQADFSNEDLFPKCGESLNFKFNGVARSVRGKRGESAVIEVNGAPADIHTPIHANDVITVKKSTAGEKGSLSIGQLPEYHATVSVTVNDKNVKLPKFAMVNGNLQSEFYDIKQGDDIKLLDYYTVRQIAEFMDVILDPKMYVYVNNNRADMETKVYEKFSVVWTLEKLKLTEREQDELEREYGQKEQDEDEPQYEWETLEDDDGEDDGEYEDDGDEYDEEEYDDDGSAEDKRREIEEKRGQESGTGDAEAGRKPGEGGAGQDNGQSRESSEGSGAVRSPKDSEGSSAGQNREKPAEKTAEKAGTFERSESAGNVFQRNRAKEKKKRKKSGNPSATDQGGKLNRELTVTVNDKPVTLKNKPNYIFVDVFDHIDFDLSKPQGSSVETLLNGRKAQYIEPLKEGDVLKIYWKD